MSYLLQEEDTGTLLPEKKKKSKEVSFHMERIDFCSVLRALF